MTSSLSTHECIPLGSTFSNLVVLHHGVFLAVDFPTGLGSLKANFTSKDRGKVGTEYLGLFNVLCHHVPCSSQQQAHIFLIFLLPMMYL